MVKYGLYTIAQVKIVSGFKNNKSAAIKLVNDYANGLSTILDLPIKNIGTAANPKLMIDDNNTIIVTLAEPIRDNIDKETKNRAWIFMCLTFYNDNDIKKNILSYKNNKIYEILKNVRQELQSIRQ